MAQSCPRRAVGALILSRASALEPQAIVGDWVGEWNNGLGASDAVYMTITKVSGDRVEDTVVPADHTGRVLRES